jgi:hypothetical protein
LVLAEVGERLTVGKRVIKKLGIGRFNFNKLNGEEVKE